MSKPATDKLVNVAVALATRLTATAAALEAGDVDYVKATVMADVTGPLDNQAAWNAEKLALMRAGGSGWVTSHGCPPADPRRNRAKQDNAGTVRIGLPAGQARDFTLYPVALFDCDPQLPHRPARPQRPSLLSPLLEGPDAVITRAGGTIPIRLPPT
jgi:hypothetical protein